jgi:hypothetical protein
VPFEVYTRQFVRTTEPKVTITNLGRFSISNSASALLKKNPNIEFVLLLWDKTTNMIGIQPTKKGDSRAYPLKSYGPKGRSGTGFSAVTFLNFINYDWSKTRPFMAEWSGNMLTFTIPPEYLKGKPKSITGTGSILGSKRKITLEKGE